MNKIVIGSFALLKHLSPKQRDSFRVPGDLDIIVNETDSSLIDKELHQVYNFHVNKKLPTKTIYQKGKKHFEVETTRRESSKLLYREIMNDPRITPENGWVYPSLKILYGLKMSHRFSEKNFYKTMKDIQLMRTLENETSMNEYLKHSEWYLKRVEETYKDKKPPKLNQKKDEFFTDNIDYIFDHDELHKVVAIEKEPAYTKLKVDGEEVLISKRKFKNAPRLIKFLCVYEEAAVLALERFVIPKTFKRNEQLEKGDYEMAFRIALRKICTTITSGFFREFAWENHDAVLNYYNHIKTSARERAYDHKFVTAFAEGRIDVKR